MTRKDLGTYKWKQLRQIVLQRDGRECWVAGCPREANEVDHIVPPMHGGDNALDNLRASCKHHNASKGNRLAPTPPTPFFDSPRPPPTPLSSFSPRNEPPKAVKRLKHLEY